MFKIGDVVLYNGHNDKLNKQRIIDIDQDGNIASYPIDNPHRHRIFISSDMYKSLMEDWDE